jgi:hypothetical protein
MWAWVEFWTTVVSKINIFHRVALCVEFPALWVFPFVSFFCAKLGVWCFDLGSVIV